MIDAQGFTTGSDLNIAGTYNVRAIHRGERERPWLLRAAALDALAPEGERALRDLGVDLVIDLREPSERAAPSHSLPIVPVPLYGEQPPTSGSLEQVYEMLLETRGSSLALAVQTIADHLERGTGIAIVHCTAGKDRTGLVVALARLAAGDSREAVIEDYARSGAHVRPQRAELVTRLLSSKGLDTPGREEELASAEQLHLESPAAALATALAIVDRHGGVAAYLAAHGARGAHGVFPARGADLAATPTAVTA